VRQGASLLALLVNLTGFSLALAVEKVVVNGVTLSENDIRTIETTHNVRVQSGRYWYDRLSGLWGKEGEPTAGQILPELDLGGPLRSDASKGTTGVFINGRQLPLVEVRYLKQLLPVFRGRYWINAQGVGGVEGGPPIFDLSAVAAQRGGGGYGGWNRNTPFGNLGGDGNCTYFNDPSGNSVMSCR
jgi:hypothetical protein